MNQNPMIVFVCEHGAAKSILAAAYFNKLARESNLGLTAIARGTNPDAELSARATAGLHDDGLTPTETCPARLTQEEVESAQRVVSFCTLPADYLQKAVVEYWHDTPDISEDYGRARDTIVRHLKALMNTL